MADRIWSEDGTSGVANGANKPVADDLLLTDEEIDRIIEDAGIERSPYLDYAVRLPLEAQLSKVLKAIKGEKK